ncbi:hypothetical protein TNCV_261161 [Trichonephila clavipes]|nr:hypothetical protein TNCV_261161 [Trichonephila clavipes]
MRPPGRGLDIPGIEASDASRIKSRRFVFFSTFVIESKAESVPDPNEIGNLIEEVVDLTRQIHLEVGSDDIQEPLPTIRT